jgi:UDP-N-acetylmuramoyl-tripeptide--D-alanyl-D-alanine ligase
VTYRIGTIGRHWALTSVAVLAAADALGCDLPSAAASLAQFHEPKGRGLLTPLPWQGEQAGLLLVDDSYNASPSSMMAAFDKMRELKHANPNRRSVAVLGDMLELGDLAPHMHAKLVEALKKAEIDVVHSAGKLMKNMHDKLPTVMQGVYAQTADALLPLLEPELEAGDMVLVKGSHGSGMWKLAEGLQALAEHDTTPSANRKGARHAV